MADYKFKDDLESPIVFVLGAGFTKAFDEDAPLLNLDIGLSKLKEKYPEESFEKISGFLKSIKQDNNGNVDAESLISRLYAGSPFDNLVFNPGERELILHEIQNTFINKIKEIKKLDEIAEQEKALLEKFASACLHTPETNIITFNYDELLDEALFSVRPTYSIGDNQGLPYWHPDGCYGFFCKPAYDLIANDTVSKDPSTNTQLLKLHGSINWRLKIGHKRPCNLDSIVHFEKWPLKKLHTESNTYNYNQAQKRRERYSEIEEQLEAGSFIIPPALDKSSLNQEPVLQLLWNQAFKKLNTARTIVFIGYSMPKTDLSTTFLLRESLLGRKEKPEVIVASSNKTKEKKKELESAYENVLTSSLVREGNKTFKYDGALKWIEENIEKITIPPPSSSLDTPTP